MKDYEKAVDEFYQLDKEKHTTIGHAIGALVDRKNEAYGDSYNKGDAFLKLLYPDGVPVSAYADLLGIIRVFDKLMRIATDKDALGENPWQDIAGYAILRVGGKSE